FDEIEKAHQDVFNVLLQILDDGRVTDSRGHVVDFKNTVIIMTSNIGAHFLLEGITSDGQIEDQAREAVMAELRQSFRPEFLNRVDDIVLFKPLQKHEIRQIVKLLVRELQNRLKDQRIDLELSDEAADYIVEAGYDPVFGARPLKRFIMRQLETKMARALISGEVREGSKVYVTVKGGELAFQMTSLYPDSETQM
ncbi:AAA family ATPase, partial [Aminobacterium sp. UBA5277]